MRSSASPKHWTMFEMIIPISIYITYTQYIITSVLRRRDVHFGMVPWKVALKGWWWYTQVITNKGGFCWIKFSNISLKQLMVGQKNGFALWIILIRNETYLVVGPTRKIWGRQLGWWHSQLNGKITNVPNHQSVYIYICWHMLLSTSYWRVYAWNKMFIYIHIVKPLQIIN